MLDFSNVTIKKLIVHGIGNINAGEDVVLSKSELEIDDEETNNILMTYFLKPFKTEEYYVFDLEQEYGTNVMFEHASRMFENQDVFYIHSANIAKHLYDVSTHPNIKKGELYIVYFKDVVIDNEVTDAIGLFKSENKDVFIKVYQKGDNYEINHESGVNIRKLDKGCLIYNQESELGFKLSIVDNTNKANEALYWKHDFLQVKPRVDNYYNTTSFLDLCRDFSEHVLTEENAVDRTEKIDFMSKSYSFFDKNEDFDMKDFQEQVIGNEDAIAAFEEYRNEYEEINQLPINGAFEISPSAVKGAKKYFKSIVKLDKNFHIYIHSKPEFIEKGFDSKRQLKYYKLFYESEN